MRTLTRHRRTSMFFEIWVLWGDAGFFALFALGHPSLLLLWLEIGPCTKSLFSRAFLAAFRNWVLPGGVRCVFEIVKKCVFTRSYPGCLRHNKMCVHGMCKRVCSGCEAEKSQKEFRELENRVRSKRCFQCEFPCCRECRKRHPRSQPAILQRQKHADGTWTCAKPACQRKASKRC